MAFNDNDVTEKILQFFSVELAAARFEEFCEQFVQKAIHYSGSQFLFCKYQFPHLKYDYSKLVCVSASVGGRPLLAKKKWWEQVAQHVRRGGLSVLIQH